MAGGDTNNLRVVSAMRLWDPFWWDGDVFSEFFW